MWKWGSQPICVRGLQAFTYKLETLPRTEKELLHAAHLTVSLSPVTFCCVWGLDSQDNYEPSTYPLLFSQLEWNPGPCMSQAMLHH